MINIFDADDFTVTYECGRRGSTSRLKTMRLILRRGRACVGVCLMRSERQVKVSSQQGHLTLRRSVPSVGETNSMVDYILHVNHNFTCLHVSFCMIIVCWPWSVDANEPLTSDWSIWSLWISVWMLSSVALSNASSQCLHAYSAGVLASLPSGVATAWA